MGGIDLGGSELSEFSVCTFFVERHDPRASRIIEAFPAVWWQLR
jgi:hypothetical protein